VVRKISPRLAAHIEESRRLFHQREIWKKEQRKRDKEGRRKAQEAGWWAERNAADGPVLARRAGALKRLGYSSYTAYLASPLWAALRGQVLQAAPDCAVCARDARQVHHLDYDEETLAGNRLESLIPLCARCHRRAEFAGRKKRTLAGANNWILGRLVKRWGKKGYAHPRRPAAPASE
jgi:hypothetical protein